LTAFVDGELDARERQLVDRLLTSSTEARDFLEKLEADSKELHNLPPRKAPDTLANSVMVTLHDDEPRQPRPVRVAPRPAPPVAPAPTGFPAWLGLGLAACILVAVGIGTFFLAAGLLFNKPNGNVAKAASQLDPFLADLFGNPAAKFGEEVKDADSGVRLVLSEIQEEPVKQRLANELKKEPSVWFDVPAMKSSQAVAELQTAFLETGITVLIDPAAKKNLGSPKQQKVQYVFYAENLSQEEVGQILQKLSRSEKNAATVKGMQDLVLMTAITAEKREMLAGAMGVKAEKIDPAKNKITLFTPIPANDMNPKKNADPQPPQRLAVLLTLNDASTASQSMELQRFLNSRQGFRPGTVQMVVLIHEDQAG
jgi:hypothetical protein